MPVSRAIRLLRHLGSGPWSVRRCFPDEAMNAIEQEVASGELRHQAELRVAVEHSFGAGTILFGGLTARERALDVFGDLRVWDTEQNNGILIYILLADHAVEIIADRGANRLVPAGAWDKACELMQTAFQFERYDQGVVEAVRYLNDELSTVYPVSGANPNELPNRPTVL